ncbi:MAG: hydrogenase maturation protease [Solirubrobacteraceae bacterium]|nr:hydrogenase maturation protease [Solirubrobacteraceae bacterium]
MTEERDRHSAEPPTDSWRPPAPDAPLTTQEVDVSDRPKQILIAGIGNTWQRDDGFGSEVARRLEAVELPDGVAVIDFGTGGLDLAYQVMYGYDALLMIDISRQGGAPGTLYVMEVDEDEVSSGVEDGDALNPHGMDPETVLRFIKLTGGWPGKVVIVACEPQTIEEMGVGLSPVVEEAVNRAVDLVLETAKELRTDEAYASLDEK